MQSKISKRTAMIEAALDLFHRKGVHATSVDDILKRSRTGKGQFTHYFKTKAGLVSASVEYLRDVITHGKAPTGYSISSWSDLREWFQTYIDFQKSVDYERSCPLGTIGNDLSSESKTRKQIDDFFEWARATLARFFNERKASGELCSNADPIAIADLCIVVMQGGMLVTKVLRRSVLFENAADEVLAYINCLRITKKRLKT